MTQPDHVSAKWLRANARAYYVQNIMDGHEEGMLMAEASQWADHFEQVLDIMLEDYAEKDDDEQE